MRVRRNQPLRAIAAPIAALALGLAGVAHAARLVDVRVGVHPGHARVVLETDAPAAYEVIATGGDEVVVRIDAASAPRTIPARGDGAPAVVLEALPDGATLARIRSSGPLRVETQVLAAPPRVVLDLRPGVEAAAPVPEPSEAPPAEPPPAPPEEVRAEVPAPPPEPTPEPVVAPAAAPPDPAPPSPAPEPEPVSAPPPAPPPVSAAPPAALALEPRSLATGLALGFAIALFAFAANRPRRPRGASEVALAEAAVPDLAAPEIAAAEPPSPEPIAPDEAAFVHDFSRMHQRLDARLADATGRLDTIEARQDRLETEGGAQREEIVSQRVAIARLKQALRPAGALRRPEREESAAPRR